MLFQLNGRTLYTHDGFIYSAVSQDIVTRGNWLTLNWNLEEWFDKPPLFMWLNAIVFRIMGVSGFSATLLPALAGIGTVMLVYIISLGMFGRRSAFIAGVVLLSTLGFMEFSKTGMMVSVVMFLFTLSIYFFRLGLKGKSRNFIFSGMVFGFALMTKGVVGFLIPLIQVMYFAFTKDLKRVFDKQWITGILAGLAIALPWHVHQYAKYSDVFLDNYIGLHIISRLRGEFMEGARPWYYHFKSIFNHFRPWFLVLPFAFARLIRKTDEKQRKDIVLLFSWICLVFLVFSLSKIKHPHYIFPTFPALAVCVGHSIAERTRKAKFGHIVTAGIVIMVLHIPFNDRIFYKERLLEVKHLSLEARKHSRMDDILWISKSYNKVIPIFYSNRRLFQISDWNEFMAHSNLAERIFMIITKREYHRRRDWINSGNYKKVWLGNHVLLYKK